jgi:hypothetical protein
MCVKYGIVFCYKEKNLFHSSYKETIEIDKTYEIEVNNRSENKEVRTCDNSC